MPTPAADNPHPTSRDRHRDDTGGDLPHGTGGSAALTAPHTASLRWLGGIVLGALLAGVALILTQRAAPAAPKPAPTAPAPAAPAGSFRPTPGQWSTFRIETVEPAVFDEVATVDGNVAFDDDRTANVYSQFSGRVTAIYARPGEWVHRGSRLLGLLATEAAQNDSDLAAAVAAEATARRQLDLARRTEQRQQALLRAQAGAEKDWLQSQADLAAADNTWRAAAAGLASTREKAGVLGLGATSGGGVASIISPIDGIVVQRQVSPGQFVASLAAGGSTPLVTVSDLRTVWVVGDLTEDHAARIKVGQPVEIRALALGDRPLRSRVDWIASSVDPATHRIPIRAAVANPDQILKPQMIVRLRVLQAHPVPALALRRSALVYDGDQVRCYVVNGDHLLTSRQLVVGRMQGDMVEVLSGLAAGDRVVTRGSLFIDAAASGDNP